VQEGLDALLEEARQESLHRVAVEPDDRFEHGRAQDRATELFLFGDHLQQDVPGDVLAGLVLDDPDLLTLDDQAPDVVERDVAALRSVVQPTVRVLLDQAFLAHGGAVYLSPAAVHEMQCKNRNRTAVSRRGHRP
jgi:hypothetical protein